MAETVAKIRHLTKQIGKKTLVKNLNFDINKGEILGFLGPNGAGKTTTMRMMVGLMSMTEGDVTIDGYSVKKNKEQALKHVGGIIENPEMYKFLTGYDNLVVFQRMVGPVNKKRIDEVTKLVGLENAIHKKVKTYSLGMRQRLGLAQALLHSPDLLILDEPTNGLDPEGIHEIRDYLKRLSREAGLAVFVSSHLLSEMELLCDRIVIIQKGEITDSEQVREVEEKTETPRIALRIEPQNEALQWLIRQRYDVEKDGDKLLVTLPHEDIPELNRKLVAEHFDVFSLEWMKKSLEERFLAKTKGGHAE